MKCRPIRFDGADSDFMYFSTGSCTRKDVRHVLTVCKRTGVLSCSCEDASFRKKRGNILDTEAKEVCKHEKGLLRAFGRIIGENIEKAIAA